MKGRAAPLKVVLIEDEPPALAHLARCLMAWGPRVEVVGAFDSVAEARAYLAAAPAPDLIISDIQLSDGLALEIFEEGGAPCPIIFTTAWDSYVQEALRLGGIDYLLKPIVPERLGEALDKYRSLQAHFTPDLGALRQALGVGRGAQEPRGRRRLLARRGGEFVTLPVEEVAWLTSEHKLVFAVDRAGKRHLIDGTLSALEAELDPDAFFRLNRSHIASAKAVVGFRPYVKGRLSVTLRPPAEEAVVVSAQNAAAFKAWMDR